MYSCLLMSVKRAGVLTVFLPLLALGVQADAQTDQLVCDDALALLMAFNDPRHEAPNSGY